MAGYHVILVAPYDSYSEKLKQEFQYYEIRLNNKGNNPKEDIKATIDFYKLYKKIRPDVVLHYTIKPNIYGTISANLLGIKTINNITGLGTLFIKQNLVTKIAKVLYKYSQSKADKVFFQNGEDYELFTTEGLVKRDKSDVLPGSGIDTQKFLPIETLQEDGKFRFLLIARMLWDKGVAEYVDAARIIKQKYPDTEFQLLGFLDVQNRSAISKDQMQTWVDEGLVTYLGTSDNVQEVIAQASCVVLPSFYREGVPRTLLESASMAKPIITTDNVGCRDVVDDGINGYLCKIKNATDLADKMEKMLTLGKGDRDMMGKFGRQKMINEFDESIVIQKYLNAIQEINRL